MLTKQDLLLSHFSSPKLKHFYDLLIKRVFFFNYKEWQTHYYWYKTQIQLSALE